MLLNQQQLAREERLREHFNRQAQSEPEKLSSPPHRPVVEKLVEEIAFEPRESLLDVGCGDGWMCRLLAQSAPESAVVGIDPSEEMIRLARRRSSEEDNILFALGSAEEIPWAEDYFSRVFSAETAYYWSSLEWAGRELFRVTAWGGQVYLLLRFHEENPPPDEWQASLPEPPRLDNANECREVFELLGFREVEAQWLVSEPPKRKAFDPRRWLGMRENPVAQEKITALLVTAKKPELPPPGPIEGPPPEPPDPLRIIK